MIHVELGVGEIVSILIAIVALAWALLKIVFNQFDGKQEVRYQAVSSRFEGLDKKVSGIDALVLEVKKLEIEQLRRDNQYAEKFATKADMQERDTKLDKTLERLFGLCTTMNDKLDNKVNRSECDQKCHVVRGKDRVEQ